MAAEALQIMNVAVEPTAEPAPAALPIRRVGTRWDGAESPWVLAAGAAAPWPVFGALAWLGVPGSLGPSWLTGGLVASAVLGAMVWLGARPDGSATMRWLGTVLGMGLMAELFAGAVTDFGARGGLTTLSDVGRGLAVWLMCVAVYELAPILAAAARVTRAERRVPALDVVAHAAFLVIAFAVHQHAPVVRAAAEDTLWDVSPWMAVALALPLAAARAVGPREAPIAAPHPRGGGLWILAAVGAVIAVLVGIGAGDDLETAVWRMRWGTRPLDGLSLASPLVAGVLAVLATLSLLWRAARVASAPSGTVTGRSDGGLTVEGSFEEPTWVAIDGGPLPEDGEAVTLLGARPRPSGAGPFRDGAEQWRARRAWSGRPDALAKALRERAAKWAAWSVACALGVIAALCSL